MLRCAALLPITGDRPCPVGRPVRRISPASGAYIEVGRGRRPEVRSARARSAGLEAGVRQAVSRARARDPRRHSAASNWTHRRALHPLWRADHDVDRHLSGGIYSNPKQVTIISEAFSEVRRVYLDRPQWKIEDVAPGYYGRSVGTGTATRWWWTRSASSPRLRAIAECRTARRCASPSGSGCLARYLHDQITIDDPVVLEKPVTYTLALSACRRLRDGRVCVRQQS
jgi:hypothetical protein